MAPMTLRRPFVRNHCGFSFALCNSDIKRFVSFGSSKSYSIYDDETAGNLSR